MIREMCEVGFSVTSLSNEQKRMSTRPIALTACVSLKGDQSQFSTSNINT